MSSQTSSLAYSSCAASLLSQFYENGISFLDRHAHATICALDAFFYNRARPTSETVEDLSRLVHRVAFNNFHSLQIALATVRTCLTIHSSRQIILGLSDQLIQKSCATVFGAYLPATAFALVLLSISGGILSQAMKREGSYKSKIQILSGALQLTDLVQSLALAVLTKNKISFLISAAMNAYSLYKNNQLNWITYRQSRPSNASFIQKIDLSYHALLFSKSPSDDKCSICLDQEGVDQAFCSNGHLFHLECLKQLVASNKESFSEAEATIRIRLSHKTRKHSYSFQMDEKDLPACPVCRERPMHNQLEVTVHDRDQGKSAADVSINRANSKSLQSTFEKAYALYNAFQGGLGLLQQIPEFTGNVTVLRSSLLLFDIVIGGIANYYLFRGLEKKKKNTFLAVIPAALATMPLFFGLKSFFAPKIDPSSLLTSKNITAYWDCPLFQDIHCIVDIYRLLTSFGLIYVSKVNKAFQLTSLLGQAGGLMGAMNVHWLCVDQKGLGPMDVQLNTYAVLSSTLAKTTEGVKSAIAYIANLQKRIVNEGRKTIVNHYYEGIFTHQTLKINYTMERIDIREYLFKPFIWTWDGLQGSGRYLSNRISLSATLY